MTLTQTFRAIVDFHTATDQEDIHTLQILDVDAMVAELVKAVDTELTRYFTREVIGKYKDTLQKLGDE
jgi:hypothetical protein